MTPAGASHCEVQRPFDALTQHQVALLRRSAVSVGGGRCRAVAESIYAQFADVPGTHPFLYDLPARIRSTARFLGVLITLVSADPLDTPRLEAEFTAVGRAHARAGLPPVLLDLGAAVFVRCMAAAAAENGRPWSPQDMFVWEALMRTGVDIQKRAYTQTANPDQNAPSAVAVPSTSATPHTSSKTESETGVE